MANFSLADVKTLREQLGTGMVDTKNALVEADGDLDKAVEILRLKGAKGNAKRADRSTSEGLVAAAEIRRTYPRVGVLVLSHYIESRYAMRLLEQHPERSGYLLKERVSDLAVLVDALRRIDDGECVLDPTIVARLVGRPREESPLDELTEREREVLGLGISQLPRSEHGEQVRQVRGPRDRPVVLDRRESDWLGPTELGERLDQRDGLGRGVGVRGHGPGPSVEQGRRGGEGP